MTSSSPEPSVVAVVWTYNRFELARECVAAVFAQTLRPTRLIVVDSASPDGSAARLRREFQGLEVIELDDNDGPGAAIAAAFSASAADVPDYYWLVEDDSRPDPECLAMAVDAATGIGRLGVLGPVGCMLRRGQWHATEELPLGTKRLVDLVVLDGALVSGDAVRAAGLPKTDYFIMMVDVEYPLRLSGVGYTMLQVGLPYEQGRLGSAADGSTWRNYYQTRNHLRMAVSLRSPTLFAGFILRTVKHFGYALLHRDWLTIRLRLSGLVDAVRGRMGRTLDPPG